MPKRVEARSFFRPVAEELSYLPECPRAIGDNLLWISIQYAADQPQGGINVLHLPSRENRHHPLPGRPGCRLQPPEVWCATSCAGTADPGVLLVGMERSLVLFDLKRAEVIETLAHLPEDERVIINDGIAIPGGAIFGTKHLEFSQPVAALYHYDSATREARELRGGQTCSNGKYLHDGIKIPRPWSPLPITNA